MGDKFVKARVEHTCIASSWRPGCGRKITIGEQYLRFSRGGLSIFSVCSECATRPGASQ